MPRDPLVYLDDIVMACDRVRDYTGGLAFDAFAGQQLTVDAVLRNLEVIGEAAKNVPQEIRARSTDVDWIRIAGLRDVIAHQYFAVNLATIWDIVQTGLPPLRDSVKRLIDEIESEA